MRPAIIIPALNEGDTIGPLVRAVADHGRVLVVDDGSSDRTAEVARAAGALVVAHDYQRGYDAALRSGIRAALDDGHEILVTMDGDGQHDPALLPLLLAPFERDTDVVIGVRSRAPRLGERLFNAYAAVRFDVPDILCGMKAYRSSTCAQHLTALDGNSIGTGLALATLRAGSRAALVPIPIRPRQQGPARFGGWLRANVRVLRALGSAIWADVRELRSARASTRRLGPGL